MMAFAGGRVLFAAACVSLLALAGTNHLSTPAGSVLPTPGNLGSGTSFAKIPLGSFSKVQHIIILMMENRAYDNYFGIYCPQVTIACPSTAVDIPGSTCVPLYPTSPTGPCDTPATYNLSSSTEMGLLDLSHTWTASHTAYANGSMNGFYAAEQSRSYTFGHYNGSTIPVYWDMAEEFGLADEFFSSTLTYSLPNHWYLVAGQTPPVTLGPEYPVYTNYTYDRSYLSQSNATPTIETELLKHANVSWSYYDYPLVNYSRAITELSGINAGSAFLMWNPLAAPNESYAGSVPSHFKDRAQIFTDLTGHNLANISYVIPNGSFSDHLPSNITNGENYVSSVVNAVQASPYWNSTVVFVSWDEYGGWYDHVAPPAVDANGLGFRVPLLVFSPWTSAGLVDNRQLSFDSILHFVEWRWGLGCLTLRDCSAPLPTGFFNFGIHRNPVYFGNANNSVYPYVPPPPGPPFVLSSGQLSALSAGLSPEDETGLDWS